MSSVCMDIVESGHTKEETGVSRLLTWKSQCLVVLLFFGTRKKTLFLCKMLFLISSVIWNIFLSFLCHCSAKPAQPQPAAAASQKAAAKKAKGKSCVTVPTCFNPLDQTCIHPESYHVAQRYGRLGVCMGGAALVWSVCGHQLVVLCVEKEKRRRSLKLVYCAVIGRPTAPPTTVRRPALTC